MPKLIAFVAFDPYDDSEMQAVFGRAEQQSEERAIRTAETLAQKPAGDRMEPKGEHEPGRSGHAE